MDKAERAQIDSENKEQTEAEKVLGSMPDFTKKEHNNNSKNNEQNKEKKLSELVDLILEEKKLDERIEGHRLSSGLGSNYDYDYDSDSDYDYDYEFDDYTPFDEDSLEEISRKIDKVRYSYEYYEAKEIAEDTCEVREAIDNTKMNLPSYFRKTCEQRLASGVGSIYEGIKDKYDMERALEQAHWKKAEHPDVMPGCQAYKTEDIKGGHLGLVSIADLPNDATIIASDPKETGKVSMTVTGQKGPKTKETWLIVGEKDGVDVVRTFHPGEPVRPSLVEVKDCPDGTKLTKEQAIALGFDLAKII